MILKNSKKIYNKSQQVLAGPSTFGKGVDQFAFGITPYALKSGKGAFTWDVDGNKYIDTIMALGAITLGHCHPDVEKAITNQLQKGTTMSLTHDLEIEVAEMLCGRIPCAEMVRFGKNGNDVTSAAIRLSRYITGNDHVLFCGYHGWQDWYICETSMAGGIPSDIKKYSHHFNYNNIDNLKKLLEEFNGKTACIIMEPTARVHPHEDYLLQVRSLANKYNTILIFDEIVTGFRFHRGGYQSVCGVTPDLACFSKAMGNGMPISALVGKKEYMSQSQEIFYSLTFGGETLSLAATKATLEVMDKENVPSVIAKHGQYLLDHLNVLINQYDLNDIISFQGYPCRNVMIVKDYEDIPAADIRTYWIQECTRLNVLTAGYHIVSLAHTKPIMDELLSKYKLVLKDIQNSLADKSLCNKLDCPTSLEGARSL